MHVILAVKWKYILKAILIRNWTLSVQSKSCGKRKHAFSIRDSYLGICNWKGNLQELFKWLNYWPTATEMCNCPKFWVRTQCWANGQSRPLILSVLPFLDCLAFPTFHHLFSLASPQSNCKLFFTSQTYMSHPFPFAFCCAAMVSALASMIRFFIFWTL